MKCLLRFFLRSPHYLFQLAVLELSMSLQLDEDIHELRRVQDTPQTNEFKSCIVTFTSTTTDRKLDKQSDTYYADVLE